MANLVLYGNGGSGNHGCEAITRGTVSLLGDSIQVLSAKPAEDEKYGLSKLVKILPAITGKKTKADWFGAYLKLKLSKDYAAMDILPYLDAIRQVSGSCKVALSAGGDNYCYQNTRFYDYMNRAYRKNGFRTVLWGCSVEPKVVENSAAAADLASYSLIAARESITYQALSRINPNTIQIPDPAFFMDPVPCRVDEAFFSVPVIGINISPMIIANEKSQGAAYANYVQLIREILDHSDYHIALNPHVVWQSSDDRTVTEQLVQAFDRPDRICSFGDLTAPELKYIISRCSFFIGARTHSTIAAYSSCVPTLVVGYSVKARGIARDLFGTEEGYVIPVQELKDPEQLTEAYRKLIEKREEIRRHLTEKIPEYKEAAAGIKEKIESLEK